MSTNTEAPDAKRHEVYGIIDQERAYQDSRWNAETTESDGLHSGQEWLSYIDDYTREAMHFNSRNPEPKAGIATRHALRKIAALAVAALEQLGPLPR